MRPYVAAAEGDLIGSRIIKRRSVSPVLLEGTETSSFPDLLEGYVYADFRRAEDYFLTAFTLIRSLYNLPPTHPAVADLIQSLQVEPRRM